MKRTASYQDNSPILYLVATPIGNLSEFSSRAIAVLNEVDVIACEDTRTSATLLKHFGISKRLIAYHNFNEEESSKGIIGLLEQGLKVALISDAGYPLLSDPGFTLVSKLREMGYPVSTISGPNAGLNALVASGMDTRHFMFYGFLNSKSSKARKELEDLKTFPYTLIFYEAPHRIIRTLALMNEVFGDRRTVIARELTKLHEEFIEGTLGELATLEEVRGEIVVLVEGYQKEEEEVSDDDLLEKIDELVKSGLRVKEAVKTVAGAHGLKNSDLYDLYHKSKDTE